MNGPTVSQRPAWVCSRRRTRPSTGVTIDVSMHTLLGVGGSCDKPSADFYVEGGFHQ